MIDEMNLDLDVNFEPYDEDAMAARLDSIQQLIHELSYSIRAQRDQMTMISQRSRNEAVT